MSDTPLARKLRLLIEANGPMTIAEYMAHCLGDPTFGYYTARDPFGAKGDFITAPEVSQMFGEIIGAWLVETWRLAGSPSPARLVELGPGRGTLMADILRVAARVSDFREAITVHLVETSPALQARQAETLASHRIGLGRHPTLSEVPDGPLLLLANEFFDSLPIRQFVRGNGMWRERVVGLDAKGNLTFGIGAARLKEPDAADGSMVELCPAAETLAEEIARRIVAHGGAALIIDYGYVGPAFGDTLQAVRGHRFADPLVAPGESDLTAHVDFGALGRAARAAGAAVHGPIGQRDFLLPLGLLERAGQLGRNADAATREMLRAAVDRLAGAGQMGALFKVLALTRPGICPPPFVAQT